MLGVGVGTRLMVHADTTTAPVFSAWNRSMISLSAERMMMYICLECLEVSCEGVCALMSLVALPM